MEFFLLHRPDGPAFLSTPAGTSRGDLPDTSVSLHLYCPTHWTDSYSAPSATSGPQELRPRVRGWSLSTRPARRIAALQCRTKIHGSKPLMTDCSPQMYPAQGLMTDCELRFTNRHATRYATSKARFIVWLSGCSMVGIFYLLVIIFGPLFFRLRWKPLVGWFFFGKKILA